MASVTVEPDSPSQERRVLADTTLVEAIRSLPQSGTATPSSTGQHPPLPNANSEGGPTPSGSKSRTFLISHPPPPEALTAELQLRIVPHDIGPLDPASLATLPMSTPPAPLPRSLDFTDGADGVTWGVPPPDQSPRLSKMKAPPLLSRLSENALRRRDEWPLILVTGGGGFIGSHVVLDLLREGEYGVVAVDNFSNCGREAIRRVRLLSSQYWDAIAAEHPELKRKEVEPPLYLHEADVCDEEGMNAVFARYLDRRSHAEANLHPSHSNGRVSPSTPISRIQHVIHFAALKSVPLSQASPLAYYRTNVAGTVLLLKLLGRYGIPSLVFSSSAVVYGSDAEGFGIPETSAVARPTSSTAGGRQFGQGVTNPYGRTKLMCEAIIEDACDAAARRAAAADGEPVAPTLRAVLLRYTNPSGNDPSGLIGDAPAAPQNLMPVVSQVLQGRRDCVEIYGSDYATRDGTGTRDFIHVSDLAAGHLAALRAFDSPGVGSNCLTYNLGTGVGATVAEIIEALSTVSQRPIRTAVAPRRPGDLGCVVCDPTRAEAELGWKAERGLIEMARDLWLYCLKNPEGLVGVPPEAGFLDDKQL